MFQMMGVFAEFERSMIQERVKAGLARAKAQGKTLGRPRKSDTAKAAIIEAKSQGLSIRKIAEQVGVSVGTVHSVLKVAA
jgi:DNA invertase Pin-like site-specific DNA recombinase